MWHSWSFNPRHRHQFENFVAMHLAQYPACLIRSHSETAASLPEISYLTLHGLHINTFRTRESMFWLRSAQSSVNGFRCSSHWPRRRACGTTRKPTTSMSYPTGQHAAYNTAQGVRGSDWIKNDRVTRLLFFTQGDAPKKIQMLVSLASNTALCLKAEVDSLTSRNNQWDAKDPIFKISESASSTITVLWSWVLPQRRLQCLMLSSLHIHLGNLGLEDLDLICHDLNPPSNDKTEPS